MTHSRLKEGRKGGALSGVSQCLSSASSHSIKINEGRPGKVAFKPANSRDVSRPENSGRKGAREGGDLKGEIERPVHPEAE
jgi:hypothetical protein